MSRHAKTEAPSKPDILHLLEYCRIDRAAKLLGCKVCDLLHLEEVGHISLYWKFGSELATLVWINLTDPELVKYGRIIKMGPHTRAGSLVENGFINAKSLIDTDEPGEALQILLFGLWNASLRYDSCHSHEFGDSPAICDATSPEGIQITAEMPDQWEMPSDNELYIMQSDLIRLRKAITTGVPLECRDGLPDHQVKQMELTRQQTGRRVRESVKPYRALVETIIAAGIEPEDFGGPISALQAKMARRGLGGELTSIDEKTLADWLRKAGAR